MKTQTKQKNILVLGSGMMVEPLIDYLLKNHNNQITIATKSISEAIRIIESRKGKDLYAEELDVVEDVEKLKSLIKKSDLVVSYVPPIFHTAVARACLEEKRNMITTSYISAELRSLDDKVKDADLIFMNEIGLDPGIDHLITHKVINEAKSKGDKIIHYESWCGALCSPEFINTPLLYKFTWAPRGALLALKNDVKQLIDNKVYSLHNNEVLTNTVNKNFHSCFNFEGYYNRDSTTYKDLYELEHANTIIRGTIRYKGFSFIFQCFKNLGLYNDVDVDENIKSWRDYFDSLINSKLDEIKKYHNKYSSQGQAQSPNQGQGQNKNEFLLCEDIHEESCNETELMFYHNLGLLALSYFSESYINQHGFTNLFTKIYASLKYLDFCNLNNKLKTKNVLDSFALMMEEKLKVQNWERDLVFMQNEYKIVNNKGQVINKKYDLVVFGMHNNLPYSAVSLLVSMPCAVTAQLILDGKIKERGVLLPTNEIIMRNVFNQLGQEKIYLNEHVERKAKF